MTCGYRIGFQESERHAHQPLSKNILKEISLHISSNTIGASQESAWKERNFAGNYQLAAINTKVKELFALGNFIIFLMLFKTLKRLVISWKKRD